MPTYVYRFVDTGETIEVQQSFDDDALTEATHPATGVVMPVKKVFTPVGVTFKGGGFYKTDSRGSSSRTSSTSASKDGATSSTRRRRPVDVHRSDVDVLVVDVEQSSTQLELDDGDVERRPDGGSVGVTDIPRIARRSGGTR